MELGCLDMARKRRGPLAATGDTDCWKGGCQLGSTALLTTEDGRRDSE